MHATSTPDRFQLGKHLPRSRAGNRPKHDTHVRSSKIASLAMVAALIIVVLFLMGAEPPAGAQTIEPQNLVINGGFEEPDVARGEVGGASGFALLPADQVPGWDLAQGTSIEIQDHAQAGGGDAAEGEQFAELDSDDRTTIYQDVPTVAGSVYKISFAISPRPGVGPEENALDIVWNGLVQERITADGTGYSAPVWSQKTYTAVATSNLTRIAFVDAGASPNGNGMYLDAVSVVAPVCESIGTGEWNDASKWSCGGVPGGDNDAVIMTNHVIKLTKEEAVKTLTSKDGSNLDLNAKTLQLFGDLRLDGTIGSSLAVGTLALSWAELEASTKALEANLEQAEADAELANVQLQAMLDIQQQTLQFMSDFLKIAHDTEMSIIRNISGLSQMEGSQLLQLEDGQTTTLTIEAPGSQDPVQLKALKLEAGTEVDLKPSLQVQNIVIASTAKLKAADGKTIDVKGDWTQDGAFQANQSTVKFSGADKKQQIKGSAPDKQFHKLVVDKSQQKDADNEYLDTQDLEADDSVKVLQELAVLNGQFKPGHAAFKNVTIASNGKLESKQSKTYDIKGHWEQDGKFEAKDSTVKFSAQDAKQLIFGAAPTKEFYKLEVDKIQTQADKDATDLEADNTVNVKRELLIHKGQFRPDGAELEHVIIGPDGKFKSKSGALHEVKGNWTQDGAFDANQSVVAFTGTDKKQQINGKAPEKQFYKLVVDKQQSSPGDLTDLDADNTLKVLEELRVKKGQFRPDNTSLKDVVIEAAGTLKSKPGKTQEVSGNWIQDGKYLADLSKVKFSGNESKTIKGTAPKTFYDLEIAKATAIQVSALNQILTVQKTLLVASGKFVSSTVYGDVVIAEGAILEAGTEPITVTGNWTNDGSFEGNGVGVIFENTDSQGQIISGSSTTTFADLTINTSAGVAITSPVVVDGALSVNGPLTLSADLTLGEGGSLILGENGSIELGDDATLVDEAPTLGAIAVQPAAPIPVRTTVSASASFSDPGMAVDAFTATWSWGEKDASGNSITSSGQVDTSAGTVAGNHLYTKPGVYTVTLTLTDDDGNDAASYQYVVVYDPTGGFVTGGGWIDSPAGAYTVDPGLTGKASFGFDSKYLKGATVPSGDTEFEFAVGNLAFESTSYEWLVVAGARAQFKGEGLVNGQSGYGFLLTAIDGAVKSSGGVDRFRIKIWNLESGAIVYDNQLGAAEDGDAATALAGGSIVISTSKK